MTHKHIAAVFIAVSMCAMLAASCAQSTESPTTESPAIETKDDEGDFGSDPDIGGSVGGDPDWSWLPPTCDATTGEVGDSDPDPDTGDVGGAPVGGYSASGRVRSPGIQPATPLRQKVQVT